MKKEKKQNTIVMSKGNQAEKKINWEVWTPHATSGRWASLTNMIRRNKHKINHIAKTGFFTLFRGNLSQPLAFYSVIHSGPSFFAFVLSIQFFCLFLTSSFQLICWYVAVHVCDQSVKKARRRVKYASGGSISYAAEKKIETPCAGESNMRFLIRL